MCGRTFETAIHDSCARKWRRWAADLDFGHGRHLADVRRRIGTAMAI